MVVAAKAPVGVVSPQGRRRGGSYRARRCFVDVREAEEWQHGHIDGSVAAGRGLLEFFADPMSPRHNEALDPTRRAVVVCTSGTRAALAALTLQDMGYEHVAVLDGGLKAWMEAGLPTNEHEYSGI